jgi:hypothetical protein
MPNILRNPVTGTNYISSYSAVLAGGPTVTVNGRTYTAGTPITVDRFSLDIPVLNSSGWYKLAEHTGTTAQRPADTEQGNALEKGYRYLDTTLGKIVVRVNSAWLDINTGIVA